MAHPPVEMTTAAASTAAFIARIVRNDPLPRPEVQDFRMKYSGTLILMAAACASPPPPVMHLHPSSLDPGVFHIPDPAGERVTRRYSVRIDDLVTEDEESRRKLGAPDYRAPGIRDEAVLAIRRFIAPDTWKDPGTAA